MQGASTATAEKMVFFFMAVGAIILMSNTI
jgi:hypothetical protein